MPRQREMISLRLTKVSIHGRQFPTESMFNPIRKALYKTKKGEANEINNIVQSIPLEALRRCYPEDYLADETDETARGLLELGVRRNLLYKRLAKVSTLLDYGSFMYYREVDLWFKNLLPRSCGDIQKVRKATTKSSSKHIPTLKAPDFFHLNKYPEYVIANNYINTFLSTVSILMRADFRESFVEEQREIIHQMASRVEKLEQDKHPFLCPVCGLYGLVENSGVRKSCGSKRCLDKLKKQWEEINRPPQPKKSSDGWEVAFGGVARKCRQCGKEAPVGGLKKVKEKFRLCKSCFTENSSQQDL
jgi:hypothetical protein